MSTATVAGNPVAVATRFGIAVLATWRVTHLLAEEDGPGDVVVRLRARLGEHALGGLMDCFACLSFWVAAPASLYVVRSGRDFLPVTLALSAAACLLERAHPAPLVLEQIAPEGEGGR
jgi:hypothetical protein